MIAYVTTLIRYKKHGWIYKIDLETEQVVDRKQIVSNSTTATHGGPHGLSMYEGQLITGTYSDIRFLNLDLEEKASFSHPYLSGVHGISVNNDRIWVSSCNNDAVLCFDGRGNLLEHRFLVEDRELMDAVGQEPEQVDPEMDFRKTAIPYKQQLFHVNHVQENGEQLLVSLHKQGWIWDLNNAQLVVDVDSSSIHDAQQRNNAYVVNDTQNNKLKIFDERKRLKSQPVVRAVNHRPISRIIQEVPSRAKKFLIKTVNKLAVLMNRPFPEYNCKTDWLRGIGFIDETKLLVGSSPASVLKVDIAHDEVTSCIPLSNDICEAVFGIFVLRQE